MHHVTGAGANIREIQMYDHDRERLFAMMVRLWWPEEAGPVATLRDHLSRIGEAKGLSVRVWSPDERRGPARVGILTTYRPEPALAILRGMRDGRLKGAAAVMIGNRDGCRGVAEQFGVPWHNVGNAAGAPDDDEVVRLLDRYDVDYVVLARYMRIVPPGTCWKFAGGRIVNLHHGLLPPFPGFRPYEDAYQHRMLTYGATVHFIVPELDAGNQIIQQGTFTVAPGTSLEEIKRRGETDNEPTTLVEGLRRVLDREVALRFHRIARVEAE